MKVHVWQAVEKYPPVSLYVACVIAAYGKVRLIPYDLVRLAYGYF